MIAKRFAAAGAFAAVLAAGFLLLAGGDDAVDDASSASAAEPGQTETVVATRQTLTETQEVSGTVGHGESFDLGVEAEGIVTWAPERGTVLRQGDTVVRVDNRPVTIASGPVPMYREFRLVASHERDEAGDRLGTQKGYDVGQLQQFLLAQGFDDDGELTVDSEFGKSTERAVKAWQESVGLPRTGRVDRSQLIFLDRDVRVESVASAGQSFGSVQVSDPAVTVTATITAKQRSFFEEGATVQVDADGTRVTGTVTDVERDDSGDGSQNFTVAVSVADGTVPDGTESVDLIASKTVAVDALTVPVRALIALAEGGYAVGTSTA